MENLLKNSKFASLLVQVITGIIGVYVLTVPVSAKHIALKQALSIEMFVQVIQIALYLWIIFRFHIPSMALTRYIDWLITTPLMLISIMLYFTYDAQHTLRPNEKQITLRNFLMDNYNIILIVLLGNIVMLIFGLAGEFEVVDKTLATILGFLGLIVAFGIIYNNFVKTQHTTLIFMLIFTIWSLYGVAYNLDEISKNIFYNILDILAKNMFGLFLSIKILNLS